MAFSKAELRWISGVLDEWLARWNPGGWLAHTGRQYYVRRHDVVISDRWSPDLILPFRHYDPVAKLRFNRRRGTWRALFRDDERRWHYWDPFGPCEDLRDALRVVEIAPDELLWE